MGGHLDHTCELEGTLRFSDTLRIDGRFAGTIEGDGHLIVGEQALVKADVRAASVSVAGRLAGRVRAREKVEVFNAGRLDCDVVTPSIRIEDGALFHGHCETIPRSAPPAAKAPLDMAQVSKKLTP
ncbi:MAG: polymer-forming cytoskeletal protein [Acidobacteriota bacterium]